MSTAALSPPTSLIPRFGLFIACVMRTVDEAVGRRPGAERPLAMLLWDYLSGVRCRLAALHARFAAGKLPAAPRARRPVVEGATADRPSSERRPPAIPPGPVLLTVFRAGNYEMLQVLLDDPEMRALLAASPQARRILGPLWRKLTPDPLPPVLRLPPRPRRSRPARLARPESRGANPSPQPLVRSSQPKPTRGEGETARPAWWTYPVSLWPDRDPAPAAGPEPPWPDGLPSSWDS
jgi:hypothetical protein